MIYSTNPVLLFKVHFTIEEWRFRGMNNRVIAFDPEEELRALVKLFQRFGHNSDGN